MSKYYYQHYSDIPPNMEEYIRNVVGVRNVTTLSLNEINQFIRDMEDWYKSHGQDFADFVE